MAADWFADAAEFFAHAAGISLRLWRGRIEQCESSKLARPRTDRLPVDELWVRGQPWATVALIESFGGTTDGGDAYGKTFFADRYNPNEDITEADLLGVGVVVPLHATVSWAVLAHELGHHLGLPHTYATDNRGAEHIDRDGAPYTAACMAPFDDDTRSLESSAEASNLMSGVWSSLDEHHPNYFSLTPNQVRRMHLSVFSRTAPNAYRGMDGSNPDYDRKFGPLLPDFPAGLAASCLE